MVLAILAAVGALVVLGLAVVGALFAVEWAESWFTWLERRR